MGLRKRTRRSIVGKPLGIGVFVIGTSTACPFDDVPPCAVQCFDFTLERASMIACNDIENTQYPIAFTGHDPDGYRGRSCFNSTSALLVVEAIEHLRAGGQLSDLNPEVISAYVTTVNTVRADLEAECILAASGQCINADAACSVVGAEAYEQLIIEETCVLGLDGTELVSLGPGEACEAVAVDQGTGSVDGDDHCPEATTSTTADSLDDAAGSSGADETTAGTTGMMLGVELRAR